MLSPSYAFIYVLPTLNAYELKKQWDRMREDLYPDWVLLHWWMCRYLETVFPHLNYEAVISSYETQEVVTYAFVLISCLPGSSCNRQYAMRVLKREHGNSSVWAWRELVSGTWRKSPFVRSSEGSCIEFRGSAVFDRTGRLSANPGRCTLRLTPFKQLRYIKHVTNWYSIINYFTVA